VGVGRIFELELELDFILGKRSVGQIYGLDYSIPPQTFIFIEVLIRFKCYKIRL
jgi:hypothetical protein